jgi:hypothetical protein
VGSMRVTCERGGEGLEGAGDVSVVGVGLLGRGLESVSERVEIMLQ